MLSSFQPSPCVSTPLLKCRTWKSPLQNSAPSGPASSVSEDAVGYQWKITVQNYIWPCHYSISNTVWQPLTQHGSSPDVIEVHREVCTAVWKLHTILYEQDNIHRFWCLWRLLEQVCKITKKCLAIISLERYMAAVSSDGSSCRRSHADFQCLNNLRSTNLHGRESVVMCCTGTLTVRGRPA